MTNSPRSTPTPPRTPSPWCCHGLAHSVLPADVHVVQGAVADHTASLFESEATSVARAVESRRLEFSSGRELARRALALLGHGPVPILRGTGREPRWPLGVVGSITHTQGHCAVAVARADDYASVGLDIEVEADVDVEIARHVVTERELTGLTDSGVALELAVPIAFSAKEAFYKAQFPLTGRILGFLDVEVGLETPSGPFRVRPLDPIPELGGVESYVGHVHRCCGLLATGLVLPHAHDADTSDSTPG